MSADGARAAIKRRAKQTGIKASISGHSLRRAERSAIPLMLMIANRLKEQQSEQRLAAITLF